MHVTIERKLNKEKVMAKNPTKLGRVLDWDFYECPIHGDEAPLIADGPSGFGYSGHYDLPDPFEL